jgi:hypothetical protein
MRGNKFFSEARIKQPEYKRKYTDEDWKKRREEHRKQNPKPPETDEFCAKAYQSHKSVKVLDDDELAVKIKEYKRKIKLCFILAPIVTVIGGILLFFSVILLGEIGVYITSPVILIGMGLGANVALYKSRLKQIIGSSIVRGVLADRFELKVYAPENHIKSGIIRRTRLIPDFNKTSGSDLVIGSYKGVRFKFSDVHLEHESGQKFKTRTTRFKGQWLILELKKDLPWRLVLRERGLDNKLAKSTVETENIEFNKRFHIQAQDSLTAFKIFTPHFMEYILKADNRASARTFMNFDGRQVHVALHNGRDLFEIKGKKSHFAVNNIATLRMQMRWDVNYITSVIDELLYNENLFGG